MARRRSVRTRRAILLIAFYGALLLLFGVLAQRVLQPAESQLSAYDTDWNDLSQVREDLNAMDVETLSLVSSPLLLREVDHPQETVFVIAGIEKDTYSLPRFADPDAGLVSFSEAKGYTSTERDAIQEFVLAGGSVIVLEDFGYGSSIGEYYGLSYSNHRLYDEAYAGELDANYTWMNITETFDQDAQGNNITGHERWYNTHPCSLASNGTAITVREAGMCLQHRNETSGLIEYDPTYHLLLSTPSAFDDIQFNNKLAFLNEVGSSSQESYLDLNDDGQILLEQETTAAEADEQGPFTLYVEACASSLCADPSAGRIFFVTDGSMLMNVLYDVPGAQDGKYGIDGSRAPVNVPENDNRKWLLDFMAESLSEGNGSLVPSENALVIFDESRHRQEVPIGLGDAYNFVYYLLVYFTSDGTAMLLLFLALFVTLEAVMIKKTDPEDWRHVFSIIYYGFGDANRYGYYQRGNKIKQVFLSRVRNTNGLTREEFDSLPARELQGMIKDPVLVKFVFEDRDYSMEQLVAVVKRVKAWGRQ